MSHEYLTSSLSALGTSSSFSSDREMTLITLDGGMSEPLATVTATSSSSTGTASATTTSASFSSIYGYGLVNAAAALSGITGVITPDVANLGGTRWFDDMIKAPEVWAKGYTGQGVIVAVVDSGIDLNHSAFQGQIWQNTREIAGNGIDDDGNGYKDDVTGWDFVQNDNSPMDEYYHGTHVAGIIDQVAPSVQLMAVRVAGATGSASYSNIAKGIIYATDNGAKVINISMSGSTPSSTLLSALQYAASKGAVVTMSAGNSGGSSPNYPAAYANQYGIAVGAVDKAGKMPSYSNKAGTTPLDYVVAPGVNIYSTLPGNLWGYKSGTSMAAPMVAGVAALLLSANRSLSAAAVETLITSTAVPLTTTTTTSTTTTTTSTAPTTQSISRDSGSSLLAPNPTEHHLSSSVGLSGMTISLFQISPAQLERFTSSHSELSDELDPLTRQSSTRNRRQTRLA